MRHLIEESALAAVHMRKAFADVKARYEGKLAAANAETEKYRKRAEAAEGKSAQSDDEGGLRKENQKLIKDLRSARLQAIGRDEKLATSTARLRAANRQIGVLKQSLEMAEARLEEKHVKHRLVAVAGAPSAKRARVEDC